MRRRRRAILAGLTGLLVGLFACQAILSESSYFDPGGVVAIAQFSDLEGTPHELTLTPGGLFFVQGSGIYVVPRDGSAPPTLVHTFAGTPTSLGYDGQDTLFACDPSGAIYAVSASTALAVAAPDAGNASCARVAASTGLLAYLEVTDGGAGVIQEDAGVPIQLTVLDREAGTTQSLKPHTETVFDIGLALQSGFVYLTLEGMLARVADPKVNDGVAICRLVGVGQTDRPKILPLPATDGGPLLLVRGEGDIVHFLKPETSCCDACGAKTVAPSVQPAQGDFTTVGPFVYWSDQNTVKRQLIANVEEGGATSVVAAIGDTSTPISEIVADGTAAYLAVGSRILRAPLASP